MTNPFKVGDKVKVRPGVCKIVRTGYDVPLFLENEIGTVTSSDRSVTLVRFPQFANQGRDYLHTAGGTDPERCSRFIETKNLMPAEPSGYKAGDRTFTDVDEAIAYATSLKTTTAIEIVYA